MRETGPNLALRLKAKLLEEAKRAGQQVDTVHTRYVFERFLDRLSRSQHRDRLVLKGGMLMMTWHDVPHRPTRDLDLLGLVQLDEKTLRTLLCDVFAVEADDLVRFDANKLKFQPIREAAAYPGLRAITEARIEKTRVKVVIDIGIGDSTVPGVLDIDYPTMLDSRSPNVRAYARETVIAEKFEAIVKNGITNSRMKDFYDLWQIFRSVTIDEQRLAAAVSATFHHRETPLPAEPPVGLTDAFATSAANRQLWSAFVDEIEDNTRPELATVIAFITPFLMKTAADSQLLKTSP
ncbi:MAG: nucleotidyl transferase AbiEii/AbiGii toxin family protein [Clostridia bacterium]|nr:nucleotidyl transferase AbiEii/AbiGii toxin family protein [Deltaproteobacteria bacterium]